MGSPLGQAFIFLLEIVLSFATLLFLMRLLLELVSADFYNPVSQFTHKATQPIIRPLLRILPPIKRLNIACLVVLLVLQAVVSIVISFANYGVFPNLLGVFFWSCGELVAFLMSFYFYAILIRIIVSWVAPYTYNPIVSLLYQLTEPVMAPARRLLKPISGIDFSPILVMIALQLVNILVSQPLMSFGQQAMLS